jgi:DNA polymerase III subunit chi
MKILFLKTTDNAMKLRRLGATIESHFQKGERVLISVPNAAAANFLDDFLWKQPKESFLPHVIASCACSEPIVIATEPQNFNEADILINLCPEISSMRDMFKLIYELMDETDATKKAHSEKKVEDYLSLGSQVEHV